MQKEDYQIVAGVAIGIIVLLIAVVFILILIVFSSKRKRSYLHEKQKLETNFKEQIMQAQLEMQEQTFDYISKEIHDNVGQVLSLAKVQLNIIEQENIINSSILFDVKESLGKALIDLRDIAKSLNSDQIINNSLPQLASIELEKISRLGFMHTELVIEGQQSPIEPQKRLILFRIIQEGLQNILKHSNAKTVRLLFVFDEEFFKLELSDDGTGFNQNEALKQGGLGLQNIINRASLIGATTEIRSAVTCGTIIKIILPNDRHKTYSNSR